MRPSMIASPPVQPISSSRSGTGSVRTTQLPKFVCRPPSGQPVPHTFSASTTSRRADDAARPSRASLSRTRVTRRALEHLDPASIAARRSASTSRAGCTVAPSRKKTPLRKRGESQRAATSSRRAARLLLDAELARGLDRALDAGVLGRRRRHVQHPALAQPDVLAAALAERAHRRHDPGRRVRELQRGAVSQHAPERRQRRPVAVQEAAVAAARPVADLARLEQRHAQ